MKNNNSNTSLKRGRPPKKDYDPEALMRKLIDTTAEIYQEKGEIKATALELSLPPGKVKKLLITRSEGQKAADYRKRSVLSRDEADPGSHAAGKNYGGYSAYDGSQLLHFAHISSLHKSNL